MKKLAIAIFEMIYPVFVKKKLKKHKEREKSYRTFYNITINDSLFKIWEEFLNSESVTNNKYSRMLWGFILDRFSFNLVKTVNEISRESPEKLSEEVLKLTPMEEATIRYVSGYIPYSLKKKYSKLKDIHTKEPILAVLNVWSDELDGSHETFLQYTKEWVDKVNRGGLFKVSDDFYIFIRHVEMHARSILNVNLMKRYAGENIHLLLMKKIENSSIIDICWNNITSRLDNDILKETLKIEVLKKWVNIRGNSFVRAWVDILKKKQIDSKRKSEEKLKMTVSRKGESALRKTLN